MLEKSRNNHIFEGKIREYELLLIDFYKAVGKTRGQNPKFTTILGYMMIHGSLTQKQLKELTGFSLATVSNTLNTMVMMKYAKKNRIPGTNAFKYSFDLSGIASQSTHNKIEEFDNHVNFFNAIIEKVKQKEYKDLSNQPSLLKRLSQMLNFVSIWKELTVKTMKKLHETQSVKEV